MNTFTYVSIAFAQLSQPGFLARLEQIEASFTSAEFIAKFAEPWGDPLVIPTKEQILIAIADYDPLYIAAVGGDRGAIAARNAARIVTTGLLQTVGPYFDAAAGYNRAALMLTGFDLQKGGRVRSTPATATQMVQNMVISQGTESGSINVGGDHTPRASGCEVQYCVGDTSVKANWKPGPSSSNFTHLLISGLEPLVEVSIRMRAVFGELGPGPWTLPVPFTPK